MNKKYIVRLTEEEHGYLKDLVRKGKSPAYEIRHANIPLKADEGRSALTDEQISDIFSSNKKTVGGIRKRLVEEGLESAPETVCPFPQADI